MDTKYSLCRDALFNYNRHLSLFNIIAEIADFLKKKIFRNRNLLNAENVLECRLMI